MVALAVLGLVLVAIGAIAAVRINADGGFARFGGQGSLGPGWDLGEDPGQGECVDLAGEVATGGNPYEGEVGTRDDGATETVDGVERGWSIHESTYTDEAAARSAFETLRLFDSPGMKSCFEEDLEVLDFPGKVEDGYGIGEVLDEEGIPGRAYHAVWRDAERVLAFTAYATTEADISSWVREEYEKAREEWP